MNAPDRFRLPDVQSQPDQRNIAIDAVGVRGLRYPVTIASDGAPQMTVATFAMAVGLDGATKGTHMSRFVELLEARSTPYAVADLAALAADMLARLDARSGAIELRFPYFVRKSAPVSGVSSLLDIEVLWRVRAGTDGVTTTSMQVVVPATSLCPCSKEISNYGAHNQRSLITIEVDLKAPMTVEDLIGVAERSASCEVYGLLKRADEKYVTERAYDNPKFVEDLVRDVALALNADARVGGYVVEAENFESIHNHSAIARIARPA
ncbi:GTP cyclohydrolase FolE2 [Massilia sp. P8910]|uniref:GTP cyclohydrolase FolE2 n=1 Tax=Massilia antarctica TaxID=2765360 RepID=UPI001E617032|nr:GTP cyclohydrolase FolE2 [Massilia antarctica]MCE3605792.1 GTP cyclohydrolase FolE2 [Massilia antarctica]